MQKTEATDIGRERDSYFDALRGLAIIFVVAIHTFIPQTEFKVEPDLLITLIREAIGCAVPLFFAISGYFVSRRITSLHVYRQFVAQQLPKIYIPAIIWGSIIIINNYLDSNVFYLGYIYNILICNVSIYYFIAVILQFYIISPLLSSINKTGLLICCIISFFMILRVELNTIIGNEQISFFEYRGSILTWIVFMAQGCYLSNHKNDYSLMPWFILTVLSLFICVADTEWLIQTYGRGYGMKPSSFMFAFCAIFVLFSSKLRSVLCRTIFTDLLSVLGRMSFWIYLTHYILIGKIAYYVVEGRIKASVIADNWLLATLVILLITYFLGVFLKKIIPSKYLTWIGIRPFNNNLQSAKKLAH